MFKKLRDKIKKWAKKVSEQTEKKESINEVELPQKFNAGLQKFEPDLERLKEKIRNIEKESPKPGEKGFLEKVTSRIKKNKNI